MKKLIIILLTLFLGMKVFANTEQQLIDSSEYSHQTVTMVCDHNSVGIHTYLSTEPLDLRGKSCPQAISYIKSIAAYPVEYTRITVRGTTTPAGEMYSHYLIEYLKKK